MNRKYKVNFSEREIIVTKQFSKEASIPNSPAYKLLRKLLKELPGFEVVLTADRRKSSTLKLTYNKMIQYICMQENNDELLRDFNLIRCPLDCTTPAPYSVVKRWFLTRFPNYNKMTEFDEHGNIIRAEALKENTSSLKTVESAPTTPPAA